MTFGAAVLTGSEQSVDLMLHSRASTAQNACYSELLQRFALTKILPSNESLISSLSGTRVWSIGSLLKSRTDNQVLNNTSQSDSANNRNTAYGGIMIYYTQYYAHRTDLYSYRVLLQQPHR